MTQIDRAVEDIKSDKGKVEKLMTLAAKLKDERWIGRQEGAHDAHVGMVKKLLARDMSLEEIADICSLDLDEVKKIAEGE